MGRRPSPPLPTRAPLSGCPSLWDPRLGEGLQASLPVTASLVSCFTGKMWPRRPTGWLRSQFLEKAGLWWARDFSSALFSPDPPTQHQGSGGDLEGKGGGGQERSATMPAQVCTKHRPGAGILGPRARKGQKGRAWVSLSFPGNCEPLAAGEGGKPVSPHKATLKTQSLPQVGRSPNHSMPQSPHPHNGNITIYLRLVGRTS